jgi:hypothetical protein
LEVIGGVEGGGGEACEVEAVGGDFDEGEFGVESAVEGEAVSKRARSKPGPSTRGWASWRVALPGWSMPVKP